MVHLYALNCEYDRGTYLDQLTAGSAKSGVLRWLDSRGSLKHIPKKVRLPSKDGWQDDPPVPIDGCRKVWRCSYSPDQGLVLINVLRTSRIGVSPHKGS